VLVIYVVGIGNFDGNIVDVETQDCLNREM